MAEAWTVEGGEQERFTGQPRQEARIPVWCCGHVHRNGSGGSGSPSRRWLARPIAGADPRGERERGGEPWTWGPRQRVRVRPGGGQRRPIVVRYLKPWAFGHKRGGEESLAMERN